MATKSKKNQKSTNNTNIVLVEGELTGHAHRATGLDLDFRDSVFNAPAGATIIHEEHETIEVPAGKYLIDRVREQDHFAEEARKVRD